MAAMCVRWRPVTVVAVLTILSGSCSQQVFEPVTNGLVSTAVLEGDIRVTNKADLLFVVDDSSSMASKQPKIAAGLPALLNKLEALNPPIDYRVAVMTFSVEERFGPCDSSDPNAPAQCSADFGAVGFTCEQEACVRRFPQLAGKLVAAAGNPTVLERSQLSLADLEQKFTQNVEVGTKGARQEQPLRALSIAFSSGTLDNFWRDDARLVVFIATDTDDCSDSTSTFVSREQVNGQLVDHCAEQSAGNGDKLDSMDAWVKSFLTLQTTKGPREVAIGAAIGLATGTSDPGTCVDSQCAATCQAAPSRGDCAQQCQGSLDPQRCSTECVEQCVLFCGSQDPGRRLANVVERLNGVLSSICAEDYGPAIAKLARVIGIPASIDLPSMPADDRLFFFQVTRAGRVINCQEGSDYTIDRASVPPAMDIVQSGACRLLPDDHWSIHYIAK
jgi:hypothetical protein